MYVRGSCIITYAKYNLLEDLVRELRESYSREEEFLDVEVSIKDNDEEMLREEAKTILERFNKDELLNFLANTRKGNSLNR
ncbi:MAG: hypothetical protein D6752_04870 [Candidatus Nitrosothermus koennekii]|nr:MAG: hypothetical protein D6752_04870 [Candidatus Nitrosothermus koennekii]